VQDIDVNVLAVIVATVAAMALGALWYSPVLFARRWLAAVGKTQEEIGAGARIGYAVTSLAWLVVAFALSALVDWAAAETLVEGVLVGLVAWAGFVATTMAINSAFQDRPRALYLIDAGYHLAAFVVIGAVVGAWQ